MKRIWIFLIPFVAGSALANPSANPSANPRTQDPHSFARASCAGSENWSFGKAVFPKWQTEFRDFMKGRNYSPVKGFIQALAFRRLADTQEGKTFAEYWISRALLKAHLFHIAYRGFESIASRDPEPEIIGVQAAALECLIRINDRYPTMTFSPRIEKRLAEMANDHRFKRFWPTVWYAAGIHLRNQIASGRPKADIQATLKILKNAGKHQDLAKGLVAAYFWNSEQVIKHLSAFLDPRQSTPRFLRRYENSVRMILGRTLYEKGQYQEAITQYKSVDKGSNELTHALSEMAWAYLLSGKQREAIGTAVNLQSGAIRQTFTPEAPMIMAMALNELCHFPESLNAVDTFKRNYQQSYEWLENWEKRTREGPENLYPQIVDFLKGQSLIPTRVGSEWLRTPNFIARQDEINLIFTEEKSAGNLARMGSQEQNELAVSLLSFARDLKKRYQLAKIRLKPGQQLPKTITDDLSRLKDQIALYQRYRTAAPVWRRILVRHEAEIPHVRKQLVAGINGDIHQLNHQMLRTLKKVAENNYFIEVEIFNGASKDIVWKNAHPNYEKIAEKLKAQDKWTSAATVWDWGTTTATVKGVGEIWEDELGSFKANVYDNCSSKDRYLALIRKEALERARAAQRD